MSDAIKLEVELTGAQYAALQLMCEPGEDAASALAALPREFGRQARTWQALQRAQVSSGIALAQFAIRRMHREAGRQLTDAELAAALIAAGIEEHLGGDEVVDAAAALWSSTVQNCARYEQPSAGEQMAMAVELMR